MSITTEEYALLSSASYANGYLPLTAWSNSIGYRPNTLRYADRSQFTNYAEEFLINSYTYRNDIEGYGSAYQYESDVGMKMLSMIGNRDNSSQEKVLLPESIPLDLSLGEAILRRRSTRGFTGDIISLKHMASILRAVNGISAKALLRHNLGQSLPFSFKTIASAGGLYPISIFIVALNVKKLQRGVYEYSSKEDVLYQVADDSMIENIINAYAMSEELIPLKRANYICLFVASAWRSMRKYGNKGLRFVLQEIGAMSQQIHLANASLGMSGVDCAAYYENEINALFNFDGISQSILHTMVCGISE